jgi:hypothetical protein
VSALAVSVARLVELAETMRFKPPWSYSNGMDYDAVYVYQSEYPKRGAFLFEADVDITPAAEFLVAAVNEIVPLARDWEQLREENEALREAAINARAILRGTQSAVAHHTDLSPEIDALSAALDLKETPA